MKISLNPFLQNGKDGLSLHEPTNGTQTSVFNRITDPFYLSRPLSRSLMKINLITLLLGLGLYQVDASTYAQQVTLKRQKTSLEAILKDFEKQSGYTFFYKKTDVTPVRGMNVDVKNMPLNQALNQVLKEGNFTFEYFDKTIVIKKGRELKSQAAPRELPQGVLKVVEVNLQQVVRGRVLDENGKPIKGASVREKSDSRKSVATQEDGTFTMPITSLNEILVISYLGYQTKEIKASLNQSQMVIRLSTNDQEVDEVVVTGIVERRKDSFTGATSTYTGKQLLEVGNQNIIQGLRALDPSFLQLENNALGANPNVLPNIEIRGKTSISSSLQDQYASDPNQPLFILDGFESSLRTIVDLNMNRVASVTILKDAASTAMYGSKASNGVVVIETVKPKPGKMELTYTSDLNVQAPDLRGYNMMNASEKLEFERLSGRYEYYRGGGANPSFQVDLDSMYSARLADVLRGVDTYWLSQPVQTGFSHRHSIYANGGDESLRYGLGVSYKNTSGVMKNSGREDWGGNIDLTYRRGKLNATNQFYVSGYKADESNYGSFSTWVDTNPYYRKISSSERYLEYSVDNAGKYYIVDNPLYNATLNNINNDKNFGVQNNFQLIYSFNSALRLQGGLQLKKDVGTKLDFKSPLHTDFDEVSIFEKGTYDNKRSDRFSYNGNIMLTYGKVFAQKHSLTANLRAEIRQEDFESVLFSVVGFPSLSTGNPSFAFSYKPDSKPATGYNRTRSNAVLASANYSYDNRYLADFSFRYDGSTAFGANKRYSPYFSGGIGWNLHNEEFLKSVSWINRFRLIANMGVTGNQNFASLSSRSTYGYDSYINIHGQGVTLLALGNPNLKWQNTVNTNIGTDIILFKEKLSAVVNIFRKRTDPLVVAVDRPSSTGIKSYPINAGILDNKGIEATLKYSPIYRPQDQTIWTIGLTGTTYTSRYDKFNNQLASLNNKAEMDKDISRSLVRFKDGNSPTDIWAVPSMGIDPATGRELFLSRNGQYTFDYDSQDIVRVGNEQPTLEGVFSTNILYKGFTLGINLRYIVGKDIFNTALYNKVENIDSEGLAKNQDKRALYDRWKQPGDIAQFKGISLTGSTSISSRFVQTERSLSGESINFGYNFHSNPWLRQLGLSSLRLNGYMNDIFRVSSVRRERGIEYPFARSVSFSLNASF